LVRLAAITPIAQPPSGAAVSTGGDVAAANELALVVVGVVVVVELLSS
jgi:hypothetical protein